MALQVNGNCNQNWPQQLRWNLIECSHQAIAPTAVHNGVANTRKLVVLWGTGHAVRQNEPNACARPTANHVRQMSRPKRPVAAHKPALAHNKAEGKGVCWHASVQRLAHRGVAPAGTVAGSQVTNAGR